MASDDMNITRRFVEIVFDSEDFVANCSSFSMEMAQLSGADNLL